MRPSFSKVTVPNKLLKQLLSPKSWDQHKVDNKYVYIEKHTCKYNSYSKLTPSFNGVCHAFRSQNVGKTLILTPSVHYLVIIKVMMLKIHFISTSKGKG